MPYFEYGEDLKQARELLEKKITHSGNTRANQNQYMETQRQINDLNKKALDRYKENNLFYPIRAKQRGVQGIVYVQFVVDETGKIVETKIIRGVDKDLDNEAVRLINSMNSWIPGFQRGEPVRVGLVVEVPFKL